MIDPRALQHHFQKVHQNEKPLKQVLPRVPDLEPLTAVQAIAVPVNIEEPAKVSEIVIKQEKTIIPNQTKPEKIKEPINLVINADPPINSIIINEIEDELNDEETYDPYGYYSGSKY